MVSEAAKLLLHSSVEMSGGSCGESGVLCHVLFFGEAETLRISEKERNHGDLDKARYLIFLDEVSLHPFVALREYLPHGRVGRYQKVHAEHTSAR